MQYSIPTEQENTTQDTSAAPVPKHFFLPGLNQLRFFAAAAVVVHHTEQIKESFGIAAIPMSCFWLAQLGREGVRLFFILSGFLITLLLLRELKKTGSIKISNFYARRMLRIWPLYFLTVALSFVLFPALIEIPVSAHPKVFLAQNELFNGFQEKLLLYCCFLPNFCLVKFPPIICASHCWSLGVEEQFYLFCPLLLLLFRKNILAGLGTAVVLKGAILWFIVYALSHTVLRHSAAALHQGNLIYETIWKIDVESFVAGGAAAWLYFKDFAFLDKLVRSKVLTFVCLAAICYLSSFDAPFRDVSITAAFAWLILAVSKKQLISGSLGDGLNYLGKISYGIYMFHPFLIYIFTALLADFLASKQPIAQADLYLAVFAGTVVCSALSYEFYENRFLMIKKRFAAT